MKKKTALLLAAVMLLGLAACGGEAPGSSGFGSLPQEDLPLDSEAEPTPEAVTISQGEPVKASYELGSANMSLELPADWEYAVVGGYDGEEAQTEPDGTFGIEFWPSADPELKLSLLYYVNGLGMCGTGVTIEEVSYANGLSGWKHTEDYDTEEKTMLTVVFTGLAGTYALNGFVPTALLEKYSGVIDTIIESAVLSKGNLMEAEAVEAAERAATVDYDTVRASHDFETGEWSVSFYMADRAGGGQVVRLGKQGNVLRSEYGE